MNLLVIYWATISIGAVLVPLSPLLKASGLVNLLNNADARLVFLRAVRRDRWYRQRQLHHARRCRQWRQ
jgi:acyl-CoA synthetase (AMP-forming)/AMP-acid ligase II